MTTRWWQPLLACIWLVTLAPGMAAAQEAAESGEPTPPPPIETAAPADTTLGALADSTAAAADTVQTPTGVPAPEPPEIDYDFAFDPTYTSKYSINRNIQGWTQTLNWSTHVGERVEIKNTLSILLETDSTIDRDKRNRSSTTTITYALADSLKLSGGFNIQRNLLISERAGVADSDTRNDADGVNAQLDYTRTLPYDVHGTFNASAKIQATNVADPFTSDRESSGPRTDVGGTFKRSGDFMEWNVDTKLGYRRQTSTELETQTETDDRDLTASLLTDASWKLRGFDSFKLSLTRDFARTQQPIERTAPADTGGVETVILQETGRQNSRSATLDAGISPISGLSVTTKATYRENDQDREIDISRSQRAINREWTNNFVYETEAKSRISMTTDWKIQRSTFESNANRRQNGDLETRAVSGRVSHKLSSKSKFEGSGKYSIQSYLFDNTPDFLAEIGDDTIEGNVDDRDVIRADVKAGVEYTPLELMTTSTAAAKLLLELNFIYQQDQTIFVRGAKSAGNQTQQTLQVNPVLTYKINPRITFTEDARIIAIARVFDFDENRNRLSRTTEFRSTVEAQLHDHVQSELAHVFRAVQDGAFTRDNPDDVNEPRKFAKDSETLTHDMTLELDYLPFGQGKRTKMFSRYNRRFGIAKQFQAVGGGISEARSTNEYTEIEWGGSAEYALTLGTSILINLRRVQNWTGRNVRNNYWHGDVTITQLF